MNRTRFVVELVLERELDCLFVELVLALVLVSILVSILVSVLVSFPVSVPALVEVAVQRLQQLHLECQQPS